MASTYTDILRLTLPTTGELDGTWGTMVNAGITALIETALAGTANVTHDDTANYTLTTASGSADEARAMFLNITGSLGAARNVVCPTKSKLYFIKNGTTGGFAVTLKTTGGTGISVPNGKYMALYCDGTNVVEAINAMGAITAASVNKVAITAPATSATLALVDGTTVTGPSATSTLPGLSLANSFTAAQLIQPATDVAPLTLRGHASATANLLQLQDSSSVAKFTVSPAGAISAGTIAVGGITGLGTGVATALAVAVGSAGALVTNGGALGTPSSGTLTNATGLPAAGVTGTALVAAAIGTTVQAYDAQLADVAGLTPTDNGVIIGNGTNFVVESGATLKTSLGLTIGTDVQAYDADLTTWAGVTPGAGVATALAVAVGSAGAPVVNGGALGTPSSGSAANLTSFPTLNQSTTGTAGGLTGTPNISVGTIAASGAGTTLGGATAITPYITEKYLRLGAGGYLSARSDDEQFSLTSNLYVAASGDWTYITSAAASRISLNDGGITLHRAASGTAGASATESTIASFTSTGLAVTGALSASDANGKIKASSDASRGIIQSMNPAESAYRQLWLMGTDFAFNNGTNSLATITSTGLAVTGALSATGIIKATASTSNTTANIGTYGTFIAFDNNTEQGWIQAIAGAAAYRTLQLNPLGGAVSVGGALSNTTGANFATSSGNVGIGTTSPGYKLTVQETGSTGKQLFLKQSNVDDGWVVGTSMNDGHLRFFRRQSSVDSERVTILGNGKVGIGVPSPACILDISGSAGGQIKFPATQNASADANTLDDYEEGTWTMTMTPGTSGTITVAAAYSMANYTKFGRAVTVSGNPYVTAVSSPVGSINVGTLPFAAQAYASGGVVPGGTTAVSIFASALSSGAINSLVGYINQGGSTILCYLGTGTTLSPTSAQLIQATSELYFGASYQT